jgi:L-rhamnose mutarotase
MSRFAFKMRLVRGQELEYKRRHDGIWPELLAVLRQQGIYDYSISLDEETNSLFALQNRREAQGADALAGSDILRQWFRHMDGLLEMNPDGTPLIVPLTELFHMD